MKTLKMGVISFFVGVVVAIVPFTAYAACSPYIIVSDGSICPLVDGSFICTYRCGIVKCKHKDSFACVEEPMN